MGPPGSNRKENALALAEHFGWACISIGDLLKKEVSKKSDYGKTISDNIKNSTYVDDKIVIDLVTKQVQLLELEHKSWIIEGFPRTKLQALALQKLGILPNRFILLNVERERSIAQLMKTLAPFESIYGRDEIVKMAETSMNEYDLHITHVRAAFNHFKIGRAHV